MSKLVEEWKPVVGYEGLYEVSDWGNVRSLDRVVKCLNSGKYPCNRCVKGKIIKPFLTIWGYIQVYLYKSGTKKGNNHTIHRLVAEAFIPNPNNLPEVNHIDEDKTNNNVENLEWCDRKYNKNYGTRTKKVAEKLTNRKDLSKQVYQYTLDGELINIWPSTKEIERKLGYDNGNIGKCCNNKYKQAYGYKWNYNEIN